MPPQPTLQRRSSGVLLHPTSLAPPRGGDLGPSAREFVDFLADCAQSWWQMLPVCPTDGGRSPYNSPSSFAGSPELVSVDLLVAEGFLKKAELGQPRDKALRAAFAAFRRRAARTDREDFESFRERESSWLGDHALFLALKDAAAGRPWTEWDEPLRRREPAALDAARNRLAAEVRRHEFVQWLFARQWEAVRRHAAARGVGLMGDAPIYVSHDSADCWAHQELFFLGPDGRPAVCAGVPPDYFCETGQLWGNPLYRWEEHARTGFSWWLSRLALAARRFDALRLDHFIAFHNYWEVPADAKTAALGRWAPARGDEFFAIVRREIHDLEIVAEDLGILTPEVAALRDKYGLPGMKIAQFSFDGKESDLPSRWPENCVGYTGTHDNDTTRAWFEEAGGRSAGRRPQQALREREAFLQAAGGVPDGAAWAMVRLVWKSPARTVLAPMQDLLGLGAAARMNRPGTGEGNWRWRMEPGALTVRLAGRLAALTGACARASEGI
ncbi:MAG TPA: 4-alpha-glucanotransferase [Elusimicrobia bacterium]|nr:MAG: 4-alpha-glucanotransferase [Elusimicrobia bacterium GWA2_66_18]HAZ08288.1 4-alpha-glucanotransferase [Elusimicrobiota bacterium]